MTNSAQQTLALFLEKMPEIKTWKEVEKYLTKTNVDQMSQISGIQVFGAIAGIAPFLVQCGKNFTIREKVNTSPLLKDFSVKFKINETMTQEISCRMVKESAPYTPNSEGNWGINILSFKNVTAKNKRNGKKKKK